MNAVEFYRGLLLSNNVIELEGIGALAVNGMSAPITIDKRTVVLPTNSTLSNYQDIKDEVQVFHPVSENIMRQDSPVFNFLKRLYRTSLSVKFEILAKSLIQFANTPALAEKANKKQREYIKQLINIDDKSIDNLEKILKRVDPNGENKILDFTIHRGEKVGGEKYNRVVYMRLPVLHELTKLEKNDVPLGVKVRKKDTELLITLMNIIIPYSTNVTEDTAIAHYVAVNTTIAPNFYTLTKMYLEVLTHMNEIAKVFGDKIQSIGKYDMDWAEHLTAKDLEIYRTTIPTFPGNDGEHLPGERKQLEEKRAPKVTPLGTIVKQSPTEEEKQKELEASQMTYSEYRKYIAERANQQPTRERHRRRREAVIDVSEFDDNYRSERESRYEERRSTRMRDSRYVHGSSVDRYYNRREEGGRRQLRYR